MGRQAIKTCWVCRFLAHRVHGDVIKWKHFPRYWPFVRIIHLSPFNSQHKGQYAEFWCFLWSTPWINGWVNNRKAGDLRRNRVHYDVIVMWKEGFQTWWDVPSQCYEIEQSHKFHNAPVPYPTILHSEQKCAQFVLHCMLWDMGQLYSGICEIGLLIENVVGC